MEAIDEMPERIQRLKSAISRVMILPGVEGGEIDAFT